MRRSLTRAELQLMGLGITEPREIDVRAIAYAAGAAVRVRKLTGCEARIVGTNHKAIISVSEDSSSQRRRFSIAHELGHWELHRGKHFECRTSDIDNASNNPLDPERQADSFAADLLMPWYLFLPPLAQAKQVDLRLLEHMRQMFDVSMSATAFRVAEANVEPVIIASYDERGRRWFARSKDVPERWLPVEQLDPDTYAADVVAGKRERTHVSPVGADAWFDSEGISTYEIKEQSIRLGDRSALVILRITEAAMQEEHGGRGWRPEQRR